jgi:hypothetical protein
LVLVTTELTTKIIYFLQPKSNRSCRARQRAAEGRL